MKIKIGFYSMIPAFALILSACATKDTVYLTTAATEQMTEIITMPDTEQEPALCCVYVCGAVKKPGVYELKVGARICDAIALAGGLREDAAIENLNQAERVEDAQMIQVLTTAQAQESIMTEQSVAEQDDGHININTASVEQLMTLSGIGQSKADSIIAYRDENGEFEAIEDIMNIPGIKEGVFLKIKDSISVN